MNDLLANYEQYPNTWDEMFDDSGKVRTIYSHFGKFLSEAKLDSLNQMKEFSNQFFKNQGVTFTVYHDNKGVERIFPIHAPIIDSIEVTRKGKVRRSKLYYLRDRIGKSAKIKEDRTT